MAAIFSVARIHDIIGTGNKLNKNVVSWKCLLNSISLRFLQFMGSKIMDSVLDSILFPEFGELDNPTFDVRFFKFCQLKQISQLKKLSWVKFPRHFKTKAVNVCFHFAITGGCSLWRIIFGFYKRNQIIDGVVCQLSILSLVAKSICFVSPSCHILCHSTGLDKELAYMTSNEYYALFFKVKDQSR